MRRVRWQPRPAPPIAVTTADTAFADAPPLAEHPVVRELRMVTLDGVPTVVQVTRPDAPGRFPVMVFGHGAGTGNHVAFDEHTEILARRGVIGLVGDKDLAAYTTIRRDYGHMARQYADLARWGRRQEWALPGRVGYYGESEGAWVAPWAASLSGADFVALVSAPVVTAREQGLYAIGSYMTAVGAPAAMFDAGMRLAGATMPRGWFEYLDFDSTRYLPGLECPVLVAYGAADISMPIVQGAQRVMAEVAGPVAVRYYASADHGLRRGPDKHVSRTFLNDLAGWVRCLTPSPAVAGAEPDQPFAAIPPPDSGVIATDGYIGVAALAALAAAGLGAKAASPRLRWPLALLRAGTVVTVVAHLRYMQLLFQLAASYRTDPVAVRIGHRMVRALGLATVAAGGIAAFRVRESRSRRAVAGAAAGLGGAAVLLSLISRWGAFGPPPPPPAR
ncbi:MAG: hypothetical protein LBK95_17395 [Bifidobacteriaceae bacterium]|jgi:hypothetical protein|nr:hypothetical protein [Bifidobacteriaceae bacterium]